jgi:hypothetical protein
MYFPRVYTWGKRLIGGVYYELRINPQSVKIKPLFTIGWIFFRSESRTKQYIFDFEA